MTKHIHSLIVILFLVAILLFGFKVEAGVNLSDNFRIIGTDFSTADETRTQSWSKNKTIHNHYNEMAVHLSDAANTKLTLRFRVFGDGLGFRYDFLKDSKDCRINTTLAKQIANRVILYSSLIDGGGQAISFMPA